MDWIKKLIIKASLKNRCLVVIVIVIIIKECYYNMDITFKYLLIFFRININESLNKEFI